MFQRLTERTAIHIRRFGWTGIVAYRRHELPRGERHYVLWLGWSAITVMRRAPSALPKQQQDVHRAEIRRLVKSLRALRTRHAPSSVIDDTMSRLMDAHSREHHAERLARQHPA